MIANEMPLISIITVSYNSERTIENTLQSVLNQAYNNIEYIIIDGASTDSTIDIIKRYEPLFIQKNMHYRYISEADEGIYEAMNKGIALCKGELIGIINSDDWYESNAVQEIVHIYSKNKEYDIFHGVLNITDENKTPRYIIGHYAEFLNEGMIEHPTCFVKAGCYNIIGKFDTNYKSAADYEWMLRAKMSGIKFLFSNFLIANFRMGGISFSKTGALEDLDIKKKYKLVSNFQWFYRKLYTNLYFFMKKVVNKA